MNFHDLDVIDKEWSAKRIFLYLFIFIIGLLFEKKGVCVCVCVSIVINERLKETRKCRVFYGVTRSALLSSDRSPRDDLGTPN